MKENKIIEITNAADFRFTDEQAAEAFKLLVGILKDEDISYNYKIPTQVLISRLIHDNSYKDE